jgi:hypothetical protein
MQQSDISCIVVAFLLLQKTQILLGFYEINLYNPSQKISIIDFLTNEEMLPIIQKDPLISMVIWSQAHGQTQAN